MAARLAENLGPDHPDVATALNNLGALYRAQRRYGEAEPLYLRALVIWKKALGPDHPDVATGLNNLAELYRERGRLDEAELMQTKALVIREQALGAGHPLVAASLNNLAELATGTIAEAEPLMRSLDNLAELYRQQGRYAEAEPL